VSAFRAAFGRQLNGSAAFGPDIAINGFNPPDELYFMLAFGLEIDAAIG
jgi:hypothetical protein